MKTELTSLLAEFASNRTRHLLSSKATELATASIIDTMAAIIAGSVESAATIAHGTFSKPDYAMPQPFLWLEAGASDEDLALIVGTASHALDYDDVIMDIIAHPSAPVLSALLPLALEAGVSGQNLIEAFAVGTEVMVRVGECLGFHHFSVGFHSTATLGTIGAAAGAARLLHLDAQHTATALSLAASMASGVRANFGSMTKPLHVGLAASNGVRAARLAASGFTAAQEALEGNEGFFSAFTGATTIVAPADLALGSPFAVERPGFSLKRYPCCYMTHKLIHAGLLLHMEGVELANIKHIQAVMPRGGTKPLIHPQPKDGLRAKFSGPYTIAAAIKDGEVTLRSFLDDQVLREDIQALLPAIELEEEGEIPQTATEVGDAPITLIATLRDGSQVTKQVSVAPGSPDDPLTEDDLRAKWNDCFMARQRNISISADEGKINELFDMGWTLNQLPEANQWLSALSAYLTGSITVDDAATTV